MSLLIHDNKITAVACYRRNENSTYSVLRKFIHPAVSMFDVLQKLHDFSGCSDKIGVRTTG